MRAVTAVALLCALLVGGSMAALTKAPAPTTSPWQIIESWTKQMPGGSAINIIPAYASLPGMYYTTSHNGTIFGVNTTSRSIQWSVTYNDLVFIQALPTDLNALVLGRASSTTVIDASNGNEIWTNSSIQMMADLTNHGDRNFILFGTTVVYREMSLGFTRLCTLDLITGQRGWCENSFRCIGLPDEAPGNTFTAPLFDAFGQQYIANFDVRTGNITWIYAVQAVLTGSRDYVAVVNDTVLWILNSTNGDIVSDKLLGRNFPGAGSAVMVHGRYLAVCDGKNYVASVNMISGEVMWNVSAYFKGQMQLQRRGEEILVLAVLSGKSTNFTRFGAYEGNMMWTVAARPTGKSLAPVHGWLGNDILYVRDVTDTWSAYGVDSGELISTGSGDLFLPRSVAPDFYKPHVGYYVTGPEGIVYALDIVARK